MSTTYVQAPDEITDLIASTIRQFYPDLLHSKATVGCLVAEKRDEEGNLTEEPAVKLHGYSCAATVKINSLKDRAEGKPDATITICGNTWESRSTMTQAAIIDHELCHLHVQTDAKGKVKLDDLDRPKLKMHLHDHQMGFFDEIAKRHGDASVEIQQAKAFADINGQLYFGWIKPPEGGIEQGPAKTVDDAEVIGTLTELKGKSGVKISRRQKVGAV